MNLTDDPGTVGWGGAIDLLNVDFDKQGRIRSRDGVAKFNSVAGTNAFAELFSWDANAQILANDSGATNVRAYDSTGTLVATDAAVAAQGGASIGTGSAGPYFYFTTGSTSAVRRWDGAAFSGPAGMPNGVFIALQPTDNRLVVGYTAAAEKSRVKFSGAGTPETWGANDYIDLHPNDGQQLRGLVAWRDLLFAFKESKFFVFYGNSTDASGNPIFNYRTIDIGIGLHSSNAVVAAQDGVYFSNRYGVWKTTGGPPERVPGLDALFDSTVAASGPPFFNSWTYGQSSQPVAIGPRIFFPFSVTSPDQYVLFVWHTIYRSWTCWQFAAQSPYLAALRLSSGDKRPTLLYSYLSSTKTIGKVVGSASDDDGTAITSRYRSGFSDLGSTDQKVVREWILEGSGSPTLKTSFDFGSLETGAAVTLGTSPALDQGRRRYAVKGRQLSWQVGGTTAWSLNNFTAHVRDKRTPGAHS